MLSNSQPTLQALRVKKVLGVEPVNLEGRPQIPNEVGEFGPKTPQVSLALARPLAPLPGSRRSALAPPAPDPSLLTLSPVLPR